MSKIRDKLFDTAHGAVPLIWWLADSVIFCGSLLIFVTIPLWWDALSMTLGKDSAFDVFLYSVGAFCIADLGGVHAGIDIMQLRTIVRNHWRVMG